MTEHFLESLEQRIAPATLINPKTVQFTDAEGDLVQVAISKGEFSDLSAFTFTTEGQGETLDNLDLGSIFAGTNLTISVLSSGSGEGSGKAEIGGIDAAGIKLGKVSIAGHLGFIDAGDQKSGIKSLTVDSLGMLTPADFGQTDRTSDVAGALSALTINGDFGGTLNVIGGTKGSLGKVFISGSMVSGAGDIAGFIHTTGSIKTVYVGGSIDGSDANAENEAGIVSDLSIKSVTVVGSLEGGGFKNTGVITAGMASALTGTLAKGAGKITTVSIGDDVIGAAGKYSGAIIGYAGVANVSVGDDVLGGGGEDSGTIQAGGQVLVLGNNPDSSTDDKNVIYGGSISKAFIGGDVTGAGGVRSAAILAWGDHPQGGKVIGGKFGEVNVAGSVTGGAGTYSALIYGYAEIKKASVGLDLVGGDGDDSGRIATDAGSLGTVSIGRDLKGGGGAESGTIYAGQGSISSVVIGQDVIGGSDTDAGTIWADGNVGTVTIHGEMKGGTSTRTGSIIVFGSAKTISIAESVTGTNYSFTGYIQAQGGVTEIFIGGDLIGGDSIAAGGTTFSGAIAVGGVTNQGNIAWGNLKKLTIGGDIVAGQVETGTLQNSGAVRVNGYLGELNVGGSLVGNDEMSVWISGLVNPTQSVLNNLAIKAVNIAEDVDHALIIAGVVSAGNPFYPAAPFARIGDVEVGGDWTASSIAAGVEPGDDGYGDGDIPMKSFFNLPKYGLGKINNIAIGGTVAGGAEGDQYGFAAQSFGKITIGGVVQQIPVVGSTTNLTADGSVKIHTVEKDRPPEEDAA